MKKLITWPEAIIVLTALSLFALLFIIQKPSLDAYNHDVTSKTAVNAIYYALTEDYYPTHGYYPSAISASILPTVSPELWSTPYYYAPANCTNDRCAEFTISTDLEKEPLYTRASGA